MILHYRTQGDEGVPQLTPVARLGLAYVLALVLLLTGLTICFLKWLEHVPYRPPADMSTLLGADELRAVRHMIAFCATVWCAALVGLVVTCWPRRRGVSPGPGI